MSGPKDGEATFRINIDGNAAKASADVATSARLAAKGIAEYESEAKTLSAELRRLRGNSDEVNAVKSALKKRLDEVRAATSSLTVELAKQGTTYGAAAEAARKYGDGIGKLPNLRRGLAGAAGAAGKAIGPVGARIGKAIDPLKKKLGTMFEPLGKAIGSKLAPAGRAISKHAGGATKVLISFGKAAKQDVASLLPSLGKAMGFIATGASLAAVAMVAAGGAAVAGAAAVAAFGFAAAAAAQKMQLQRQALLGNAEDAGRLGDQIQALAGKVPQGVAELNELGRELSKTRLSGKAIVDTMNAVAQATGAVDASAGSKIQEIITRGQMTGRMFLNQLELQGTGLDFDDVARAYADGTRKSLDAARRELMTGAIPLEQGAEAIRKATEKKFGAINVKQAFSLENAPKKLKEQLQALSSGVDLTPITKGLQYAFGQLAPEAPLGRGVKMFMESFGNGLVDIAGKSIPVLLEGFKWMIVGALRVATFYYETKKKIQDAWKEGDWIELGKQVVIGLWKGITGFGSRKLIVEAVKGLATAASDAFTGKLDINSPSGVFEDHGEALPEGTAKGVQRGAARAQKAVDGMIGLPPAGGPSGVPAPGGSPITVTVNIHGAPTDDAQAMQSPAFLSGLSRALRDGLASQGLVAA